MKTLRLWLLATALLGSAIAEAQQRTCGTIAQEQHLQHQDPTYSKKRRFAEHQLQQWTKANPESRQTNTVITIPVVVHVLYNSAGQNISDAQILSQLAVLNEDFRKMNADAGNVPALFQGVASDTEIEFCLAQRDPQGNATTGITRTQTNVAEFTGDEVKFTAQGGKNAWDTGKYLNMWVCNLGGGLLGYAQFPGGPAATDGVVMGYTCFGRVGTVIAPYHKGRTTTHEIGHWLGLYHIWGDDNCGNDLVADTPTQQEPNYGCLSFPHSSCSNTSDMFMNYMDYVDDACMNMFSQGQEIRMVATLNTNRASLLTSNGCVPVNGGGTTDAGIEAILEPGVTTCTLTFSPAVTLRNYGSTTLTSVGIGLSIDNGIPAVLNWTGSLAPGATQNVVLPQVTVTAGPHSLTVSTTSPNNGTDGNISNDSQSLNFVAQGNGAALSLPYSESFEGNFTPPGWLIQNNDNNLTWESTDLAARTGNKSVLMNNYQYNASGEADFLVMPAVDLTSMQSPTLSFEVAYKLYTDPAATPNFSDTLQVWVSTDCGTNWYILYDKSGSALATGSAPLYLAAGFVPDANEWRRETIDLSPIAHSNFAVFAFRNATGFENNLYLDDVNISGVNAATESEFDLSLELFPNPTSGIFDISLSGQPETDFQVSIFDQLGRQVQVSGQEVLGANKLRVDLRNLPQGVYLAKVQAGNSVAMRRIVLSR